MRADFTKNPYQMLATVWGKAFVVSAGTSGTGFLFQGDKIWKILQVLH